MRRPLTTRTRIALGVLAFAMLAGMYAWLCVRQKAINPRDTSIPNLVQFGEGIERMTRAREIVSQTLQPDGSMVEERELSIWRSWLWTDLRTTFGRLAVGLMLAVVSAVVVGVAMGCFEPLDALLSPPLDFLAKIPPTAMLAIFFVAIGVGFGMFVAMLTFGVFPTLTQSVFNAVKRGVPAELVDKAFTLGATRLEVIYQVLFKHSLPAIIEGARMAVGPAMVYLIAAEMLFGDSGFGYRIRMQQRLQDMAVVYVYLIVLGLAGYALDQGFRLALRKVCPWYGRG